MNKTNSTSIALLIGRIVVGTFYLFYALQNFIWLDFWAGYAASKDVPLPYVAVIGGGLLLVLAGLSLITGIQPHLGVAAAVLFLLPVSLFMHNFWAVQGLEQTIELAAFSKNMALAGSALMYLAIPAPWAYHLKILSSVQSAAATAK